MPKDADAKKPRSSNLRVGTLIRTRRKELSWTQKDLARKLDVTPQQIQKYEAGINSVGIDKLMKLSQLLRLPLDQLLSSCPSETRASLKEPDAQFIGSQTQQPSLKEIGEIFQRFLALKSTSQRYIINMINEAFDQEVHDQKSPHSFMTKTSSSSGAGLNMELESNQLS